mgnify:CR=1 FL=1
MAVQDITIEAGFLVITRDAGGPRKYPIADILRAADVPNLNIRSLTLLTTMANLVTVLVKTLIEKGVLDENFEGGYDLQYLVDTLETDLGVSW